MNLLRAVAVGAMALLLASMQGSQVFSVQRPSLSEFGHTDIVKGVSHIGGPAADVALQGDYAYVGYPSELAVVDISDITSPRRVGYVPLSANDLAVSDWTVYVAGARGVEVVDVSIPNEPKLVGHYETSQHALGIGVTDNTAYVVTNRGGLHIVDLQDRAHPIRKGFLPIPERLPDIVVAEPFAYVATNDGLHVVDVSDAGQPKLVASLDQPGFAADLAIDGERLLLTNEFQGLLVIDISNPLRPQVTGGAELNSMVWDVAIVEGVAYVASTEPGLHVIADALGSEPAPQRPLSRPDTLWALAASDTLLCGVNINGDLHLFDLSDALHPILTGTYNAPGYSTQVAVHGSRAYAVADMDGAVYAIDNGTAAIPEARNLGIATDHTTAIVATASGLIASGEHTALWAGVMDDSGGYHHDPVYPAGWSLRSVAVSGRRVYGIGGDSKLLWVDDPDSSPLRHGSVQLAGVGANTVASEGKHVYVGGDRGLHIFEFVEQIGPVEVTTLETTGTVDAVQMGGSFGYIILDTQQLCILDIADKVQPRITGCVDLPAQAAGTAISGNRAYVALGEAGVAIVDLSELERPTLLARIDVTGQALDIATANGVIYVAAANGGLVLLQL